MRRWEEPVSALRSRDQAIRRSSNQVNGLGHSIARSLYCSIALLLLNGAAQAAPTLTVGAASGLSGTTVDVPITFDPTTASVAAIQFTLTLPAGLSTATVTAGAILNTAGKS